MNPAVQSESSVVIENWDNVYCVPADHPDAEQVRRRLDEFVSGEVIDSCRRCLASLLDPSDRSVWLIREIQIEMALDAGAVSQDQTAFHWGEKLALEIGRSLESGANSSLLLRFDDRPAYIAQWARDMSSGRAWDKWYYGDFDSLRSLSTGAAIVEGISRNTQHLENVLLQLAGSNCLEPVLRALHNGDAERLWRRCLPGALPEAAQERPWVSRLLALWNGTALSQGDEPARDALRLFAAARHEWPDSDGVGLCTAVDGLLLLRRVLAAFAASEAREFLAAAVSGALERARQLGRYAGCEAVDIAVEFAARNSQSNVAWGEMVAAVLKPAQAEDRAVQDAFLTELGGIFLLGPPFADLDIHNALRQAAETCDRPTAAAAVLRHLLAVRCLGAARAASSIKDPAVRLFSGIDSRVSLAEMADVLHAANVEVALQCLEDLAEANGLAPLPVALDDCEYFNIAAIFPELELAPEREHAWSRIAHAVLRHFASRQPGFGGSSPGYLWQNFLAGTSAIHTAPESVDVRLPQVPLSLVLRISGAYRSYELPWWKGVEICLRPPSQ